MRMDPHNMVKYKAHMPHRYMHHPTHVHTHHPLHTSTYPRHLHHLLHTPHHSLHTPLPSLPHTSTIPYTLPLSHTHTSTIPYTHLHYPLHTPPPSLTHTSTIPYTHLHHPLHTPPPSPTHTSTIPYTHLHHPYTHLHHPLHTPPPSPTHTSTIPYTNLHHPIHTPPPSLTHTSTIPYTHLHHPLHTPPQSLHTPPLSHTHISMHHLSACLPYIYRSNNYFRCPTSGPGQRPKTFCSKNVLRQKHFVPNPTYALRQIRHTLCATYALRQIRFGFLRQIAMFWYATYRATVELLSSAARIQTTFTVPTSLAILDLYAHTTHAWTSMNTVNYKAWYLIGTANMNSSHKMPNTDVTTYPGLTRFFFNCKAC